MLKQICERMVCSFVSHTTHMLNVTSKLDCLPDSFIVLSKCSVLHQVACLNVHLSPQLLAYFGCLNESSFVDMCILPEKMF